MRIPYFGAGILIWTKDKSNNILVLLGKRSINPSKSKWSIPGGAWDERDGKQTNNGKPNYIFSALRETKEELHYEVENKNNVKFLWEISLPFFHFKVYSLEIAEQRNFSHNYEFSEVKWFNINSIPKNSVFFIKFQVKKLKRKVLKYT